MTWREVNNLDALPPLLSTGEVLRILNVSRRTLARLESTGKLQRLRIEGSVLRRYKREHVLALIVHT